MDEKVPANVWFVTSDTVFPCVPWGMALWVIQQLWLLSLIDTTMVSVGTPCPVFFLSRVLIVV